MSRTTITRERESDARPVRQHETSDVTSDARPGSVAPLHQAAGNQAVQRLYEHSDLRTNGSTAVDTQGRLERVSPSSTAPSEETASLRDEPTPISHADALSTRSSAMRTLQPKLTVSRSDGRAEREAERVAEQVIRTPEPPVPVTDTKARVEVSPNRIQRMCSRCQRRSRAGKPLNCEDCEQKLQRSTEDSIAPEATRVERAVSAAGRAGRPLPGGVRSFFEARMGGDFSQVRIHTDSHADRAARGIGAAAYTIGRDIAFRSSAYRPETRSGKRLLAHELTHVRQQTSEGRPRIARQDAGGTRDAGSSGSDAGTPPATPQQGPSAQASPTVSIESADVTNDEIAVRLQGSQETGTLTVRLAGPTQQVLLSESRAAGQHQVSFSLGTLPVGEYTSVAAGWSVGDLSVSDTLDYHIRVLGNYRHSQYNVPEETQCGGAPRDVYITDDDCNFTPSTLPGQFIDQVNLNGSGISAAHGNLARENFCLNHRNAPADAANRSFRQVGAFSGGCGPAGGAGRLDTDTVAHNQGHPHLGCGDRVYINTVGTKTVTDFCPGCGNNQLDNFTNNNACAGIVDLGNFVTVKIF